MIGVAADAYSAESARTRDRNLQRSFMMNDFEDVRKLNVLWVYFFEEAIASGVHDSKNRFTFSLS